MVGMKSNHRRTVASFVVALALLASAAVKAAEIRVMSSGGLTAAFQALIPAYEKATGNTVLLVLGPSMGTAPEAIPARLDRGEPADVLLMVGYALDGLAAKGKVIPDSRAPVANSKIAMAVKAGAPKPDISTLDRFKQALLDASSIAYSDSASGVYIEREMYKRLGLEDQLKGKSRMIVAERVGNVVARGDAEVGFQQVSELLPIKGITLAGELPPEVQNVTVFSAGVAASSTNPEEGRRLIAFLVSAQARPIIIEMGLEPVPPRQ
jgi:molybdate transport system substrate-binding protein